MQAGYFKAAWGDISSSRGWLRKLLLLALLSCIPVFGAVVVCGYLSGWAREIAWGVKTPLPARVFGNEDGMLYRRGFYIFVIVAVYSMVPAVVQFVGMLLLGGLGSMGFVAGLWSSSWSWWIVGPALTISFTVTSLALSVLAVLFAWIGSVRAAIYGRVSAGFQLRTIWAMIRHDAKGLLRILAMAVLWSLLLGLIVAMVVSVSSFVFAFAGVFAYDSFLGNAGWQPGFGSVVVAALGVLLVALLAVGVAGYVTAVVSVFVMMLTVRALGYWVQGFDVPHWRGQADPLPFMERQ